MESLYVCATGPPNPMPLDKNCLAYMGRNLLVLPNYGNGWTRPDLGTAVTEPVESLGPEPFAIRVEETILCNAEMMGISGKINDPNHQFNDYWCSCLLRDSDERDFTAKPGQYMVWIAQKKLPVSPAPYPNKALYKWVTFDKSAFCLCGYGTIAESAKWIHDIY